MRSIADIVKQAVVEMYCRDLRERAVIRQDIDITIEIWRIEGLTPRELWQQLTGRARRECNWRHVRQRMIDLAEATV